MTCQFCGRPSPTRYCDDTCEQADRIRYPEGRGWPIQGQRAVIRRFSEDRPRPTTRTVDA